MCICTCSRALMFHVHFCVQMHTFICAHACADQRSMFYHLLSCIVRQGLSLDPESTGSMFWPASFKDLPVFPPVLGLQACASMLYFSCEFWMFKLGFPWFHLWGMLFINYAVSLLQVESFILLPQQTRQVFLFFFYNSSLCLSLSSFFFLLLERELMHSWQDITRVE